MAAFVSDKLDRDRDGAGAEARLATWISGKGIKHMMRPCSACMQPQSVLCLLVPFDDMHDTDDRLCKIANAVLCRGSNVKHTHCYLFC